MIQVPHDRRYAELVYEEHHVMRDLIRRTEEAVHSDTTSAAELRKLMVELIHRVCGHFWHEEKDGYMKPALDAAPHLQSRAEQLRAEHAKLLDDLEELRKLVEVPQEPGWVQGRLRPMFDAFLKKYRAHEAAEDALLQEAFQGDLAPGD